MPRLFRLTEWGCAFFVVLTAASMAIYPGGSISEPGSRGYSLSRNFLSDLGQTRTPTGAPNLPSMTLFAGATVLTALALSAFFLGFAGLLRRGTPARRIATAGAVCGGAAAACFLGVAATPWNLFLPVHIGFVLWAFRAFLAAAALDYLACLVARDLPRRFIVFFGFSSAVLLAYMLLLTVGPSPLTPEGSVVQAVAQKCVVYGSVFLVWLESADLRRWVHGKRARAAGSGAARPH